MGLCDFISVIANQGETNTSQTAGPLNENSTKSSLRENGPPGSADEDEAVESAHAQAMLRRRRKLRRELRHCIMHDGRQHKHSRDMGRFAFGHFQHKVQPTSGKTKPKR